MLIALLCLQSMAAALMKNPNEELWEGFPDRSERLGFDMDSGNVTFGDLVDEVAFEQFDELPQFEQIRKSKRKSK